jgi:ParE-like toxin of type II ParDE toxin-antitoxin system
MLEEDQAGQPDASHEQVVKWVESWGGQHDLPAPGSAIRNAISRIVDDPQIGHPGRVEGTKEFAVPDTDYIVIYRVADKRARILSVIESPCSSPGAS